MENNLPTFLEWVRAFVPDEEKNDVDAIIEQRDNLFGFDVDVDTLERKTLELTKKRDKYHTNIPREEDKMLGNVYVSNYDDIDYIEFQSNGMNIGVLETKWLDALRFILGIVNKHILPFTFLMYTMPFPRWQTLSLSFHMKDNECEKPVITYDVLDRPNIDSDRRLVLEYQSYRTHCSFPGYISGMIYYICVETQQSEYEGDFHLQIGSNNRTFPLFEIYRNGNQRVYRTYENGDEKSHNAYINIEIKERYEGSKREISNMKIAPDLRNLILDFLPTNERRLTSLTTNTNTIPNFSYFDPASIEPKNEVQSMMIVSQNILIDACHRVYSV